MTPRTRFLLQVLIGMALGLVLAITTNELIHRGLLAMQDYLPLVLAAMYVLIALTIWINPFVRKTAQPGERLWKRAAALLVSAIALAAPALVPKSANVLPAYLVIVAIYGLGLVMMHRLVSGLDELTKQVYVDTNQVTMNVLLVGLFLWGAAERMDLIPFEASIWMLCSLVLFFHFTWSQIAWMRRGLGNPLVAEE
jgi:hypothetical protein